MPIPWYYIWSENYRIFHEIMQDSIKYPEFELIPIEIPQSRFDSELYNDKNKHFWYKSLIKVDTILDCLKKGHEESNPYILFTDIDIIVRENIYNNVKGFMDKSVDMVFMKEGSIMNIGFMLLRVSDEVYNFWSLIRSKMIEKDGLDQMYVNECLLSYPRMYTHFDENDFILSNNWNVNNTPTYKVIQVLCSNPDKLCNMFEKTVSMCLLMDMRPYMKYSSLSKDILHHVNRILVKNYNMPPELLYEPPV